MTLDDLIALNDEIAALTRAGVPLEPGLAALGSDMPGRLGRLATQWAQRSARGEPLDQAIQEYAGQLPPAYRAVVQAGMKAGRLSAALEAVAASARRLAETHRTVAIAVTYPLLVFIVAWGGMVFFTRAVAPSLADMFLSFHVPGYGFVAAMARLGQTAWYWGPAVPIAVVLLLAVWWYASARPNMLHGRRADWLFGWLPWVGSMLRWSRAATFLEILTLLVENHTPLDEAVILAAEACGDAKTLRAAQRLAAALRQGWTGPETGTQLVCAQHPSGRSGKLAASPFPAGDPAFPPLVNWLMLAAGRDGALLPALRHTAAAYHRRARQQSDLLRMFLPVFATVVVGGTITALYALTLFIPYSTMLRSVSSGG
jgi:general secretion pathway protein F